MTLSPANTSKLLNPQTGSVVFQSNKVTKAGKYFLDPGSPQYNYTSTIIISGFNNLPSGLKKNGGGFPSRGYLLLKEFSERLKRFELTIDKDNPTSLKKQ